MNDSTRGTMQRLIYTHLCLFCVDLSMLYTVLFSFHLSIIDVLPASVTYLAVSSVLSVACSRCYAHSCLAEWRSCVLVTLYFQMQGDRGPMMRPKVRRFVVMKGDPGPPGTKGKRHAKSVYVIHCKTCLLQRRPWWFDTWTERRTRCSWSTGEVRPRTILSGLISWSSFCALVLAKTDRVDVMVSTEWKVKWVSKDLQDEE